MVTLCLFTKRFVYCLSIQKKKKNIVQQSKSAYNGGYQLTSVLSTRAWDNKINYSQIDQNVNKKYKSPAARRFEI